jgi:teichoic acid transport system permease protein
MVRPLKFILFLSWDDFISAYRGSFLGGVWGLVEPMFYICLTFFFFQFVMAGSAARGHPYATFVLPVMLAWMVVSSGIQSSVSAIFQYRGFLHEAFDMRALAIVKLLPIFCIHVLMLGVLCAFFVATRQVGGLSPVFLAYAMLCLTSVLTGVFWLLMSIAPFIKDMKNIVGIILQFGFWVVPIFWERSQFPGVLSWIMFFNPFYYPLETYRVAFLGLRDSSFLVETIYFWTVCITLLYFGNKFYRRGRVHFGDVVF